MLCVAISDVSMSTLCLDQGASVRQVRGDYEVGSAVNGDRNALCFRRGTGAHLDMEAVKAIQSLLGETSASGHGAVVLNPKQHDPAIDRVRPHAVVLGDHIKMQIAARFPLNAFVFSKLGYVPGVQL